MKILEAKIAPDEITGELAQAFDYQFEGVTTFSPPNFEMPKDFSLGLIVGPSGSGKTTILKTLGEPDVLSWNPDKAICSHFESAQDAKEKLGAVGLNSVPVWMKPFHVLSMGEQFRADLAKRLKDGAIIDEFTSVVDRSVAKSCSFALQRYVRDKGLKNIVLATCHYDIVEWLQPDWTFDTATGTFAGRGSLRRPEIVLEVLPCSTEAWSYFKHHHYLADNVSRSSRCWLVCWEGVLIGFCSILSMPSGYIKNAWRGHRTVVLPEYQGLGLGVRISDAIGEIVIGFGGRYFSKTANYRMGEYRNKSENWRPTSKNGKNRSDYNPDRKTFESGHKMRHRFRVCYSHEYLGSKKCQTSSTE